MLDRTSQGRLFRLAVAYSRASFAYGESRTPENGRAQSAAYHAFADAMQEAGDGSGFFRAGV